MSDGVELPLAPLASLHPAATVAAGGLLIPAYTQHQYAHYSTITEEQGGIIGFILGCRGREETQRWGQTVWQSTLIKKKINFPHI